jgi:hypothetical protein
MKWTEDNIENFIKENKDKFDKYSPQKNHNEHFLIKLANRFRKIISIIPYLVKVSIITLFIFIFSFLAWHAYLCPPLTHISLKYCKFEYLCKYQIHKDNKILLAQYIKDSTEIKAYKLEMIGLDLSYNVLKQELKTNPSGDNIMNMLGWYRIKLKILDEKIKYYKCK